MYTISSTFDTEDSSNKLHSISTPNGLVCASFANRGLALVSFGLKHSSTDSAFHNISCGFDSGAGYRRSDNPFFGAFIGRVANRIRDGHFKLDGVDYQLVQNNFGHCLHGGAHGYDKIVYNDPKVLPASSDSASPKLKFSYVSPHMEEGFPGEITLSVTYWVEDESAGGALFIEYEAFLTGPDNIDHAIINLTNHSYFNIGNEKTISGTQVTLGTIDSLEVTNTFIPTGKIVPHPLVPADKSTFALGPVDPDIDHCFVFTDVPNISLTDTRSAPLKTMAATFHPVTGINFIGSTTDPAFQFYTGKYVNVAGVYPARAGFCLESSRYVDAVSNDDWKDMMIIGKDKNYGSLTKFSLHY
ncbi:galactose mutarotase-like domain-containing protein [Kockiozyma suomiensis]|uniref:galactose mutarotase-like domain-containing protein n=1 Tax=Kockiozyma suomiensis TaxID=1337062 RepID=UPI003343FEEC